jgi:hypothetical protein
MKKIIIFSLLILLCNSYVFGGSGGGHGGHSGGESKNNISIEDFSNLSAEIIQNK